MALHCPKQNDTDTSSYRDLVAYVPTEVCYTPGLTFEEILTYTLMLRLKPSSNDTRASLQKRAQERAKEVMKQLGIKHCAHIQVPEEPKKRGEFAADLRVLNYAIQLSVPKPVMVFNEPTRHMDDTGAVRCMQALTVLAELGHTVICSIHTPSTKVFRYIQDLTLLRSGTITYSGDARTALEYFSALNYEREATMSPAEFLLGICEGAEMPRGAPAALTSDELRSSFVSSMWSIEDRVDVMTRPAENCAVIDGFSTRSRSLVRHLGGWKLRALRGAVLLQRAVHIKLRERTAIKKLLGSSLLLGLLDGYVLYGYGRERDYCLSFIGTAFNEVADVTAAFFLLTAFIFAQQALQTHIITKKLQLYQLEKQFIPPFLFFITTVVAELVFSIISVFLLAGTWYPLLHMPNGREEFSYFVGVLICLCVTALIAILLFSSVFYKEFLVRDAFFFAFFLMVITSGYVFQVRLHCLPFCFCIISIDSRCVQFYSFQTCPNMSARCQT
jgi:ABC-type multidrug transport system ATPase subunit